MAMGWTEPEAGSDVNSIRTIAIKDQNDWILNGNKTFITGISFADAFLVSARTVDPVSGESGIGVFIVEKCFPGFEAGAMCNKYWWRGSGTGEFFLRNCRVPNNNLLGQLNKGSHVILSTLNRGRTMIASWALGTAQGAFERALSYSKQRLQFGQPIAQFQAIQFYLAEMATEIEVARAIIYTSAALCDNGKPFTKQSSMAKLYATEAAIRVTDKAIQICGGLGLDKEFGIDRYYRDARITAIAEGTTEVQKVIIARELLA